MGIVFLLAFICMSGFSPAIADKTQFKTYVIHVKHPNNEEVAEAQNLESWYKSFMPTSMTADSDQQPRIVHSYQHVMTGFAARLTEDEVNAMKEKDGFVSARPEKIFHLHTTHTPGFLGLHKGSGFWKGSNLGKGVIIGVLDTGVLPDHVSFSDAGMPPPPAKWKGKCEFKGTSCNNKLIGARNFDSESTGTPPSDEEGHGTHTASTAAGNFVKHASVFGNAKGTAVGMAPHAHLAIYKVCSESGCAGSDILAALDAAIEDGVDVLSLSLGGQSFPFHEDPIALGAFAATRKGIFVSCSAGNEGPANSTLSNEAPWILTVAASTMDRSIKAMVKLGNGKIFDGESLFQPRDFPSEQLPLVYAGAGSNASSAFCGEGSLKDLDVKGKVVVCDRGGGISRIDKGKEVKNAGGAAMILTNGKPDGFSTLADPHSLPAAHVGYSAGLSIKAYINSSNKPTATLLFKGTIIGKSAAPEITSFSSRGPSLASPGILKPDITGPGVSVLAAWPSSVDNRTDSKVAFNMISGTSMSCPHLSGIAALLKSSHPEWSPAAIKSAIMTTADVLNLKGDPILDETHEPADVFAVGAGHVNPSRANDPGLIYDIQPNDYIPYLCGLGYNDTQVRAIIRHKVQCCKESSIPEAQLNYPSFSVAMGSSALKLQRTVTNVGEAKASYIVKISAPQGVDVSVKPRKLDFTQTNQKKTYTVTFERKDDGKTGSKPFAQGFLEWVSAKHSVRSPISVKFE